MKQECFLLRRVAVALTLVLIVGLVARVVIIFQFSMGPNTYSDENGYLTGAITFANTGYISYSDADSRTSATCVGVQFTVGTLLRLFGYTPHGQIAAHVVYSSISLITAFIAFLFVTRWAGNGAGLLAAVLCTFEPGLMTSSCLFLTETPFICLCMSAMYLMTRWLEDDSFACYWGSVLCVIGAALFRGVALMTLIVPVALLIQKRKSLRPLLSKIAVAVLAFVLVFTPWWIRNAKMYDRFVMFTTNSGDIKLLGSYVGFGVPEGTYNEMVLELDAEAWREGFQEDPVRRFARRGEVGKERLSKWFSESPVKFILSHVFYKPFLLVTTHAMSLNVVPKGMADFAWWLIVLLAIWELLISQFGSEKPASFRAMAIYLLIGCMASAVYVPLDRYGLPYYPVWLMFAACAMKDLFCRISKRTDASA